MNEKGVRVDFRLLREHGCCRRGKSTLTPFSKCGQLEEGFLRLRCAQCRADKLGACSCRKRGFCRSCGARRMAEPAALLADEVLPERPLRQWVLRCRCRWRCAFR